MNDPRSEAAVMMAIGSAAAAGYAWLPHPVFLAASIGFLGTGILWLIRALRRSPEQREQIRQLHHLWSAVNSLPTDRVLEDPVTGERIRVERERGFLTLAVMDPAEMGDQDQHETAMVSRYPLGFFRAPGPPPVLRYIGPLADDSPVRMSWRRLAGMTDFNKKTGALETSADELKQLREQLVRTMAAHG